LVFHYWKTKKTHRITTKTKKANTQTSPNQKNLLKNKKTILRPLSATVSKLDFQGKTNNS